MSDHTHIRGQFYAQHALMIDENPLERLGLGKNKSNGYGAGNILLLNGNDRLVIPYNLLAEMPHEDEDEPRMIPGIGPFVNQLYTFTLTTPPGVEPDRLKAIRSEDGLDTTLLRVNGPFGHNSALRFTHLDYVNGKGMTQSTSLPLNAIRADQQDLVRRLFKEEPDLTYRVESCVLSPQNLYK